MNKLASAAADSVSPPKGSQEDKDHDFARLARQWLRYEAKGTRLRMAHRCVEWDGWEEGLVESILGPEDHEEEWFQDSEERVPSPGMSESSDGGDDVGNGGGGGGIVISTTTSMTRRKLTLPRSPPAKK